MFVAMVWNHALYFFYGSGPLDGQMPIQAIATKRNHGSQYDVYKMFGAKGHNDVGILLKKSWDVYPPVPRRLRYWAASARRRWQG
jgi:hypothetical protein